MRARALLVFFAAIAIAWAAACSLNPQPLPPTDGNETTGGGSGADASVPGSPSDGAQSDSGTFGGADGATKGDAAPPPGDAAVPSADAGATDAGDAASDAPADAPSDVTDASDAATD